MKKFLVLALTAALTMSLRGAAIAEEPPQVFSSGDYGYRVADGTAILTEYTGDADTITIPSEIDEYRVTGIDADAFEYQEFRSVSFPDSIRTIGQAAFEYCEITDSLRLPKNVTISKDAFCYAVLPSEVVIPEGATVEERAFGYCEQMEQVYIDPDVVLKSRAFAYCDDLTLAVFADGSRLETKAFEYCEDLETAIFCGDVQTEEEAFSYCEEVKITTGGDYEALRQSAPDGSPGGYGNAFTGLRQLVQALFDGSLGGNGDTAPEERELEIIGSPATLDGVTVTLTKAVAVKDPTGYTYTLAGTLENNSDEGIMQVNYTIALIDRSGEEFRSFGLTYDGEETAIPPQAAVEFYHDDIQWGIQAVPAAVKIEVSSVQTETELPPAHVPQKGEYLYQALGIEKLANIKEEPPVELSFHLDQGGYGRTATFQKGDALNKAVELLCEIQIGEISDSFVTDNYNWIWLTWEDGSETFLSLNLNDLEYSVHNTWHTYRLENLDGFWSYCYNYLKDDVYE